MEGGTHGETKGAESLWAAIRARLEAKRKETFEALRSYPPQVAGCDTYYQFLAEQRAKISGELRRLDELRRENPLDGIDRFVRASSFIDDDTARELRAELLR
jgi:hypothetical protein